MLSKLDKLWTIEMRFPVYNSHLQRLDCPLTVFDKTNYYRIFVKEIKEEKKQRNLISNHQIKRKKTPGWEADVSLPFLKVPTSQKI
jgi:hypothetical protein